MMFHIILVSISKKWAYFATKYKTIITEQKSNKLKQIHTSGHRELNLGWTFLLQLGAEWVITVGKPMGSL